MCRQVEIKDPKKVVIYLSRLEYVRNYLDSDAFREINLNYDVTAVIAPKYNENYTTNSNIKNVNFQAALRNSQLSNFYFEIVRWRYRELSKSFVWVENWQYGSILKRWYGDFCKSRVYKKFLPDEGKQKMLTGLEFYKFWAQEFPSLLRYIRKIPRRYLIRILASKQIYKIVKVIIEKKLDYEPDEFPFLETNRPDLLIFPTSASEPIDIALITVCKKLNIKTFMILDNWDNVSSKTILWRKPDFLGSWGPQSTRFAMKIQQIDKLKIFNLGTPRFDCYFENQTKLSHQELPKNYILFIGTVLEFNELKCLSILSNEITNNPEMYGDTKIVYRPHPRSRAKSVEIKVLSHLSNVILDPQVANLFLGITNNTKMIPELNYYSYLLENARLVVGGLSTMVLEATIMQKKYIALVHHERFSMSSPDKAYEAFEHYRGIENLGNIMFCNKLKELASLLQSAYLNNYRKIDYANNDVLKDIYFHDSYNYSERIEKAVAKIIR